MRTPFRNAAEMADVYGTQLLSDRHRDCSWNGAIHSLNRVQSPASRRILKMVLSP